MSDYPTNKCFLHGEEDILLFYQMTVTFFAIECVLTHVENTDMSGIWRILI